ncbi:CsgG/HfaB family protein [Piscinibacterium candidicorallinum]|uniref:CsgG/HfaB family protein n=1 Tax=Piscinibacterium candidicorallinum TaxID=1793872 RepID=A0ABV7H1S6_9BURK
MHHRQPFAPFKRSALPLALIAALTLLAGCDRAKEAAHSAQEKASAALDAARNVETGKGGSVVTGSAGPDGAKGEAKSLVKCDAPIAVVAVSENPRGYAYATSGRYPNLPESPVPLIRLMLQQSGCFRVVDRFIGLNATKQEIELQNEGLTRKNSTVNPKGKVYESQFTIIPNLVFSEKNAGAAIGGVVSQIPGVGQYAGALSGVKFAEAQITLFVTDNETTEQVIAAEGAARATDMGVGGLIFGRLGGAGGLGWGNTNEGKVVAAAMLDAVNKVATQAQKIVAKEQPPASVQVKKG